MLVGMEERQTDMGGAFPGVKYPLWYTAEGQPVNFESTVVSAHIQKVLTKACELADSLGEDTTLHLVQPHGLRVTFAQRCARAGMELCRISDGGRWEPASTVFMEVYHRRGAKTRARYLTPGSGIRDQSRKDPMTRFWPQARVLSFEDSSGARAASRR